MLNLDGVCLFVLMFIVWFGGGFAFDCVTLFSLFDCVCFGLVILGACMLFYLGLFRYLFDCLFLFKVVLIGICEFWIVSFSVVFMPVCFSCYIVYLVWGVVLLACLCVGFCWCDWWCAFPLLLWLFNSVVFFFCMWVYMVVAFELFVLVCICIDLGLLTLLFCLLCFDVFVMCCLFVVWLGWLCLIVMFCCLLLVVFVDCFWGGCVRCVVLFVDCFALWMVVDYGFNGFV